MKNLVAVVTIVLAVVCISRISWGQENPYVVGETAHYIIGNDLAVQCYFWVRNPGVDTVYYSVQFFDEFGMEVLPFGIGRSEPYPENSLSSDVRSRKLQDPLSPHNPLVRVYSPRLANYQRNVTSCKVTLTGWSDANSTTFVMERNNEVSH